MFGVTYELRTMVEIKSYHQMYQIMTAEFHANLTEADDVHTNVIKNIILSNKRLENAELRHVYRQLCAGHY